MKPVLLSGSLAKHLSLSILMTIVRGILQGRQRLQETES